MGIRTQTCVLWSTSRNELWAKGATSGDVLDLVEVRCNCEQNSLLYLVRPRRAGACHTRDASGSTRPSCYYRRLHGDGAALEHLAETSRVSGSGSAAVPSPVELVGRAGSAA